ncbi:MAG: hypothetical protein SGARI_004060, partial [Bacillariaceae sp.]
FSVTCRGALAGVENYSEKVLQVIKGPDNCNVDDDFDERLAKVKVDDVSIISSSLLRTTGRTLPSRFLLQKARKTYLYDFDVRDEQSRIQVSPSQDKLVAYEYRYKAEIFRVFDLSTRKRVASLFLKDVHGVYMEQVGYQLDEDERWDYENPESYVEVECQFVKEAVIAIYGPGGTYLWDFTMEKVKQGLRYLGKSYSNFVPGEGDEILCNNYSNDRVTSFALQTLQPRELFSLRLKPRHVVAPNLIGMAHGKFLVAATKDLNYICKYTPCIQVYNVETGKVTHSEDVMTKLQMIPMEGRHDTFCILSGPGNVEVVTVDERTGKFSNRCPLKVKAPKFGERGPLPVVISEKLLATTESGDFGDAAVAFDTYDLYCDEQQGFAASPKAELRFGQFSEIHGASIKRNALFVTNFESYL